MLPVKILEVRDRGTFIPVMATKTVSDNDIERNLISRAGYDTMYGSIILTHLETSESTVDPYKWGMSPRTLWMAHRYINRYFDEIPNNWVVDVEYIRSETQTMKIPERYYNRDQVVFQMNPPSMAVTNGGQDYDPFEQFKGICNELDKLGAIYEFDKTTDFKIYFTKEYLSKLGDKIYPFIVSKSLVEVY